MKEYQIKVECLTTVMAENQEEAAEIANQKLKENELKMYIEEAYIL